MAAPGHRPRLAQLGRVPAAVALHDLAFRFEGRHHAVEIVGVYPHRVGQLADRDAGASAHELERLLGARAAAARAAAAPAARGARRAGTAVADAGQRRRRLLQAVVLVDERPKLLQPRLDLATL